MLKVECLNTYGISHVPNPSPPSVPVFRASKLELILSTFHVPSPPSFCMTCKHVSQGSPPLLSRLSGLQPPPPPLGSCLVLAHNTGPLFCPPTLVEGDYSNGFVHPSVLPSVSPSVRRHNLVSASPPTVFKGF